MEELPVDNHPVLVAFALLVIVALMAVYGGSDLGPQTAPVAADTNPATPPAP